MYLDQFPAPNPVLIGHHQGLAIYAEGQGFALPRVRTMLMEDLDRYSDLCGRTVGQVISLLDWRGRETPFCVTACCDRQVVAAAWAGTITSRETGTEGCNISFGVRPDYGGRGLATLLSAIAYQQCLANTPTLEFVNVQTEAGNLGARAIATRLGLRRAPLFDRETRSRTPRLYVTYRAEASAVAARCSEIFAAASAHVHLPAPPRGSRRPGQRERELQPRIELPPSITALFVPSKGSSMPPSIAPSREAVSAAPLAVTGTPRAENQVLRNALAGPHGLLPGIALVEHQLEVAKRGNPSDAPFPLAETESRIYHDASVVAYVHSLEMVSSNWLRQLHNALGPAPATDTAALAQNQLLAEALFGQHGVTCGAKTLERCLSVALRARHADAPFPLTPDEGAVWHRAQRTAYQYVLEMLCTHSVKKLAPQFAHLVAVFDAQEQADETESPRM
jgi:RimJ/RimL family protein N-acetyltransferase